MKKVFGKIVMHQNILGDYVDISQPVQIVGIGMNMYSHAKILIKLEKDYIRPVEFDDFIEVQLTEARPMSYYLKEPLRYVWVSTNTIELMLSKENLK